MKKAIISFLFSLSVAVSFGQVTTIRTINVDAGGTITLTPATLPQTIVLTTSGAAMSSDFILQLSGTPPNGQVWRVWLFLGGVNLNGHTIEIFGNYPDEDMCNNDWSYYTFLQTSVLLVNYVPSFWQWQLGKDPAINGQDIQINSLFLDRLAEPVSRTYIDTTGRGRIWYGNATNQTSTLFAGGNGKVLIGDGTDVNSVAVSGDIAITSAGVTSIAAGSIVNADVNASAAIALSKLAALTASKPVVTDGSGVLTTTNQVPANYGGTGQDFSASTGFQKWSAGTASVSAITDIRDLHVSFASNSQGTYYITFPVAATVTNIEARVETALAGTDSATLEIQDNSGTDMTGSNLTAGLLVLGASATTGTGYTSTLTSNNTFTAGQRMRIISNKATAGGTINVQVTYTRNE